MCSLSSVILLLLIGSYLCISDSLQDDITSTYNVNSNTNQETVKIGNTKYNNYNFQDGFYQPTQLTQLVFNVPKSKKLRKYRLPTEEEYEIKEQILNIYYAALREAGGNSLYLNHLGRILMALNPKYIATHRVKKIAFSDPSNPSSQFIAPETELVEQYRQDRLSEEQAQQLEAPTSVAPEVDILKLTGANEAADRLKSVEERFRKSVEWDTDFADALQHVDDGQLDTSQFAFKKLIVCLNNPDLCKKRPTRVKTQYPPPYQEPVVQASAPPNPQQVLYPSESELISENQLPGMMSTGYDSSPRFDRTGYGLATATGVTQPYYAYSQYAPRVPQSRLRPSYRPQAQQPQSPMQQHQQQPQQQQPQ